MKVDIIRFIKEIQVVLVSFLLGGIGFFVGIGESVFGAEERTYVQANEMGIELCDFFFLMDVKMDKKIEVYYLINKEGNILRDSLSYRHMPVIPLRI